MEKSYTDKYDMSQEDNIFQAKRILVDSVYREANLEGIAVTFAETEDILNDINISNVTPNNISKVCCLRDGWKYLFDNINKPLDLVFLEELHEIVARFDVDYKYLGKPRTEEVLISGTDWRPDIPNIDTFLSEYNKILSEGSITEKALRAGFYIMRTQLFKDGNKRIGSFVANKILIESGKGIFSVPVDKNHEFKRLLIDYYESNDPQPLIEWTYDSCITGVNKVREIDEQSPGFGEKGFSMIGALQTKVDQANGSQEFGRDSGLNRDYHTL